MNKFLNNVLDMIMHTSEITLEEKNKIINNLKKYKNLKVISTAYGEDEPEYIPEYNIDVIYNEETLLSLHLLGDCPSIASHIASLVEWFFN